MLYLCYRKNTKNRIGLTRFRVQTASLRFLCDHQHKAIKFKFDQVTKYFFFTSTRRPANDGGSFLVPPVNNNLGDCVEYLVVFLSWIDEKATQHMSVMRTWTDSFFRIHSPPVFWPRVAAQRGVPECKQLINIMTALMSSSGAKTKTLTGKVVFFLWERHITCHLCSHGNCRSWGHCLLAAKSNTIGDLNPHQVSFRGRNQPWSPGGHCGYKREHCVFFLLKPLK